MKKLAFLLLCVLTLGSVTAQQLMPIPADPELRTGKLPNGMTYYIRHNEKPKGQANFHILHYVGAIQENDNQQGLAHFLEHMAFNGTKNLPGKTIINYLEKIGVRFGSNLNAGTGWDQTTYLITDVPTARQGVIDTALLVLHDWSHFIALQPEEIDSERGVIMEELRTRDGAGWRSQIELIKALGKGSKYAERNLIGYLDGLKGFDHTALEAFYHTWYRPENQAVIVVGDIDVDAIEKQIKELMSDIPASPADAPKKEVIVIPDNQEPIVSIYTDPEMQASSVQLFIKHPALPLEMNNTVQGAMINTIAAYASTMENARLQEMAMKPDAPFLSADMGVGELGIMPTMQAVIFGANTQDGKLIPGFEAIYTEMERVRRFGFTQSEFERAQENLLRRAEQQYTNRNDRRNSDFVNTYLSNYTKNSPMPDAQTEWEIDSALLKQISVEFVNQYMQQMIRPENQVIIVTAPQREGIANPSEADLLAVRTKVMQAELTPYEDNTVKEPLIPATTELKGSPVKKTTENAAYGTTEWTLKNGVKVVVKPTTYKADEVRLAAVAFGGLSNLSDEEYRTGELMSSVNAMSGVGKFSASDLKKQLSGKTARVNTSIGAYTSGMSGYASPKDMETMLQLLYLNFTSPRFDENDCNTLMRMLRSQLENIRTNPDFLMQERIQEVVYNKDVRRKEITLEELDAMTFESLPGIYSKLFPSASGFTFYIVGNVDLETLKPLVEKYIGSIPTSKTPLNFNDDLVRPVSGQVIEDFRAVMQQPKVSAFYNFTGALPAKPTIKDGLVMTFLTETLNSRYLTSIREEKGGTYGVQVSGSNKHLPVPQYSVQIFFDTNAEMVDELREIIMKEIEQIAAEGPRTEDVEKTREFLAKQWKNSLEQNGSWMNYIQSLYLYGEDSLADYEQALRSVTNADVQALAKRLLDNNNRIQVIMRPAENTENK